MLGLFILISPLIKLVYNLIKKICPIIQLNELKKWKILMI